MLLRVGALAVILARFHHHPIPAGREGSSAGNFRHDIIFPQIKSDRSATQEPSGAGVRSKDDNTP